MKLIVFFSWQEDIDTDKLHNKKFLCDCINSAIKNIENKGQLKNIFFEFQESTSNIAGNPSIPQTLEERIKNCDIFIADFSIVDSYSWLELLIRKLRKAKTKLEPNTNVYGEYNKALANLSDEQIITIMNTINGNPEKDNNLIPFDTRERRFPCNYFLKSDKNAQSIKDKVISKLENAIRESALSAVKNNKKKYQPFINFNNFKNSNRSRGGYIKTNELEQIQNQLLNNRKNLRLLGLSGIGKTRLIQEAFEGKQENVNFLYCNCYTNESYSVISAINRIFEDSTKAIIVVDNCEKDLFEKIIIEKNSRQAANPIIAIYHDANEKSINETIQIILQRKQQSVVEGIIDRYNQYYKPEQREKLIEFSGGIPLIAERLCQSLREGYSIGVFNDETLLSKLLGNDENSNERKMLRSLSLFDFIGVSEEARKELLFVVGNKDITPIDGALDVILNDFDALINKSIKREIMERNGRFIAIRPKAIGLQLTSEWISECNSDRLLRVVKAIQESDCAKSLIESFSRHFKYMQYDERAVLMLKSLLQFNSPFHNAEVINTELGSRLFRSLVEVNPTAVADCLWSVFGSMTTVQLRQVVAGRRNIIWTLEKLCFDRSTYKRGMKLMLMFGSAENETWGNNATNNFIHLFKIYLPGTQASLSERFEILKWGKDNESFKGLIIKAIESALEATHFFYVGGAENQGMKQLEHYKPQTWGEIFDYWNDCINILYREINNETKFSDECSKIFVNSIWGLCRFGFTNMILPIVKNICEKKKYDWDDMHNSLLKIKSDISLILPKELKTSIDNIIEALTKKDFASRFKNVRDRDLYLRRTETYQEIIVRRQELYNKLATEFVKNEMMQESLLMELYQIDNISSNPFGYSIAKQYARNTEKLHFFIDLSIKSFLKLDKYNPYILLSFAQGLDKENYNYLICKLKKVKQCSYLMFSIMATHGTLLSETEILFDLVKQGIVSVRYFLDFWRDSTIINSSSDEEIINFFSKITKCDKNGFNVVISMMNVLMFFNEERSFDAVADYIIAEFKHRTIDDEFIQNDDYMEIIESLLQKLNRPEFAVYINNIMIERSKKPNTNILSYWKVENIYKILLDKYFIHIAHDLLSALVSENTYSTLYFQLFFEPKEYNDLSHLFFKKENLATILNVCKYSSIAQERIMRIAPVIEDGKFSPIVSELLDKYGSNTDMLRSLSYNIGSFSWTGSPIPLYESQKETILPLLKHSNPIVVDWAETQLKQLDRDIAIEQQREAENKFLYS